MNSALKPVLTSSSGPQNPPMTTQLNKQMHPQNTPATYGQPSTHMPQNLVNLPHGNPSAAHTHPNPAHQTNHYSLNVPNAPQHFSSNNPSTIPASNHPVPNVSQAAAGGQTHGQYPAPKSAPYPGGYQPNLGHPPNQNPMPPVSQTLPATQPPQPPQHAPVPPEAPPTEKPQSNGTAEAKSPTKPETQENHVSLPKEKVSLPAAAPPPAIEKPDEKIIPAAVPELKPKSEEAQVPPPAAEPAAAQPGGVPPNLAKTGENRQPEGAGDAETKAETDGGSPEKSAAAAKEPVVKATETPASEGETSQNPAAPKPKEKEQKTPPAPKASSATPKTPTRKSKTPKPEGESPKSSKTDSKPVPIQKSPGVSGKSKRTRTRTQPYQSPLPEIEIITKISSSTPKNKNNDEKLIVFYKNEFLAVRNSEGSFYICQAVQNIYKSSPKIRIRWLSQDENEKSGEVYTPDFYDNTDFDCILTNLNLERVDKGKYRLPPAEKERTDSILKRSLAVEKGEVTSPSLTEEHPDGLDLSLYKEESQLKKRRATKRRASSPLKSPRKVGHAAKSPEQSKARKVSSPVKKTPNKKPAAAVRKPPPPPPEKKVSGPSSRTDRAKRRSDNQNHNTVSPVLDPKKARVLAKVARKTTAVSTGSASNKVPPPPPPAKNAKATKPTPSSSKVQKPPPKAATRKTKRSLRK